jgi:hypothetical membrane protein
MARRGARMVHLVAAWAFVACLVAQVFLAGLGVFDDPTSFVTHRNFGYLIGWFVLVLLVAAIVGRLGRRQIGLAALVLVLFAFQSVFVALRQTYPAIAALHPLNGFVILLVTIVIARDAWLARRLSFSPEAMPPEAARSESPA